jgi:hypothetical protein
MLLHFAPLRSRVGGGTRLQGFRRSAAVRDTLVKGLSDSTYNFLALCAWAASSLSTLRPDSGFSRIFWRLNLIADALERKASLP